MAFKTEPGSAMVNTHCAAWDRGQCSKERFPFILQDMKLIPAFIILQLHNDICNIQ